jgi:ubiquinone/menaquinone biosynthesis C-methylase UbiE
MAETPSRPAPTPADADRRMWYEPEDILDTIQVKAGTTCVDLGCGVGTFTFLLARRVGMEGKVYAVDTSVAALDQLKIKKPGVNIITLRAELSDTRLSASICDLVLMPFSLSTAPDAGAVLSEAARLLKPDGRIAVVEWRPAAPPPGPPIERRIRNDRLQRLLESHGFIATQRLREGAVYYTLVAQKAKPAAKPPAKQPQR